MQEFRSDEFHIIGTLTAVIFGFSWGWQIHGAWQLQRFTKAIARPSTEARAF